MVGLPVATYIAQSGLETWGYDISPMAVAKARRKGIKAFDNWNEIPRVEAYLVCVSTGLKSNKPELTGLLDVMGLIQKTARGKALVSIESTILPGVSRDIYHNVFREQAHLVHVPHRYWSNDPERYGVRQPRLLGAIDGDSLDLAIRFYRTTLKIPVYPVSSIEVAEMCKIAEQSYRYVSIAFAEELRMLCDRLNLDFEEIRAASNTKWNIQIPEARDGIDGACLPKDIQYLRSLAPQVLLLNAATEVDQKYRERFSNLARA